MPPHALRLLYAYTYWAFEPLWQCIMCLSDQQFTEPVAYSVGSVRNHTVHVLSGTARWVARLQLLAPPGHLRLDDSPIRALAKAQWDRFKRETLASLYSLDQPLLDEVVHWELSGRGVAHSCPRWQVLLHVANHGTDHRAQVLALLHMRFGVATVQQDLTWYLTRGVRAAD
jgi:uncharacterized damage-inducible protein DinB